MKNTLKNNINHTSKHAYASLQMLNPQTATKLSINSAIFFLIASQI